LANSSAALAKEREQALSCYAAGFEAYLQQQWQEALGFFKEALGLWPEDGPSRVMAQRCHIYQETPPPEDWDGVFEHVSK
jgi:adenylate cyclase